MIWLQIAVTAGTLLGHIRPIRPPGTVAESAMRAPPDGATTVLLPSEFWMTPICRSVRPVVTVVLPSLIEPLAEEDATHWGVRSRPSAATMAGASTGHLVNGAHSPFSCAVAAVAVPIEAKAPTAVVSAVATVADLAEKRRRVMRCLS